MLNSTRVGLLVKVIALQILLLLMFATSLAWVKDLLAGAGTTGMIRVTVIFLFPILPWSLLSSALTQHYRLVRDRAVTP